MAFIFHPHRLWTQWSCGVALLLLSGFSVHAAGPIPVVVSQLHTRTISDPVEALGTALANESVQITTRVTEKITWIGFDDGQAVQAGARLIQLDDAEEQANLRAAQAVLVEREGAYQRARTLFKRGVGNEADMQDALARVDQAKAEIAAVRARIESRTIRAPFAGVVGLRNISVGALAEPAQVLTTLDDLSLIKVDFAVPALHLSALKPGLSMDATTAAWPEQVFQGTLRAVATRVDPITRTLMVRATINNRNRTLHPGMLIQLVVNTRPRQALMLPEAALFAEDQAQFVFRLQDQARVEKIQILTGSRRGGEIEVLQGLSPSDQLVTHGGVKLSPGDAVEVIAVDDGHLDLLRLFRERATATALRREQGPKP